MKHIIFKSTILSLLFSFLFLYSAFAEQASTGNNQQTADIVDGLKAAGPRISGGADVFISADYIFWAASTPGIVNGKTAEIPSLDMPRSNSYQLLHDWGSGFKVALGLNMSHDEWFTLVEYIWLRPHTHRDITPTATQTVRGETGYGVQNAYKTFTEYNNITGEGQRWKSDTHLDFNVIDWRIGRAAYTGRQLTLSTYTGLKGTWQKLDTHESWHYLNHYAPLGPEKTGPLQSHYTTKWGGVGVLGGMDLVFYMTDNFYMEAKCALTGMWSTRRFDRKDHVDDTTTNTQIDVFNTTNKSYPINFVADLFLGLGYQVYFGNNDYGLSIAAGWETQVWVNWAQDSNQKTSDLTLQGLDVKLRFDF